MKKLEPILFYLALILLLYTSWFSREVFYVNNNESQTGFYALVLVLLLAGIIKVTGTELTITIEFTIQLMVKKCKLIIGAAFYSQTSGTPCVKYTEKKEEAYRSKESTPKFMLQKW